MKRGSTGIVFSPAFLGKLNPNGGRGSRGRVEMVDNAVNVVNAEHRRFVNRDNISSSIVMSKLLDALASGELEELVTWAQRSRWQVSNSIASSAGESRSKGMETVRMS
jgi:MarR-like DNA-binding transcriptional regulator SgrR of sgrS sRNA